MANNAQINFGPQLARVAMPLVRLLQQDGLSWSDREDIANAIQAAIRTHAGMEAERRHLLGAGAAQIAQTFTSHPTPKE